MSGTDRLLSILHVGFAIFTLGPLTAVIMSSPRYIRRREIGVVKYLHRTTRIYALLTLGIFLFGLLLADRKFSQVWLTASMTLFIVTLFLLLIIARDQRKAIHKLELAAAEAQPAVTEAKAEPAAEDGEEESAPVKAPPAEAEPAKVETGRIAAFSGVVTLIWIVILVLMIWH